KVIRMLIENKKKLNIIIHKTCNIRGVIWKLFMDKCINVEFLRLPYFIDLSNLPGSYQCLKSLSELECEVKEPFKGTNFKGLKVCHNLYKINVKPLDKDDEDLYNLIKIQLDLKEVNLFTNQRKVELIYIDKALSIQSYSLEKLSLRGNFHFRSQYSFLSSLHN